MSLLERLGKGKQPDRDQDETLNGTVQQEDTDDADTDHAPRAGDVEAQPNGTGRPDADSGGLTKAQVERQKRADLIWRCVRAAIDDIDPDLGGEGMGEAQRSQLREQVSETVEDLLNEEEDFFTRSERREIVDQVMNELIGFGPIDPLLADGGVTEIMINGPATIFAEREGQLERTPVRFRDNDHIMNTVEKILSPLGRRVDESSPMVDARLPDGSRVNVIIPPLAVSGPTVTIRKFSADPFTVKDLTEFGTMNVEIARFLQACVEGRINVVVSGGTGSGKTTTLNVLSSFIPGSERIVTIEDAAELQLQQSHVVTLEARPPNVEGRGEVTIRELVINALRMRPDRMIVGEVRGGEALDMLQAMNTGHDGSITTGHANSPRDLLSRLETMVLMAGVELPVRAIREQIAAAVDLIAHQSRFKDGTRKITKVTEVLGMEGDKITLQDIFVYDQQGFGDGGRVVGRHRPTGIVPQFMEKLEHLGSSVPIDIFNDKEAAAR